VDAQLAVVLERREDRVRHRADAHLERRAVVHEPRHVPPDGLLHIGPRRRREVRQRPVHLHAEVDLADVQQPIAVGARHLRVDLRHDGRRALHRLARGCD